MYVYTHTHTHKPSIKYDIVVDWRIDYILDEGQTKKKTVCIIGV